MGVRVACPDCGSTDVVRGGRIPSTNTFAGRERAYVLSGGFLWRCSICYLAFRFPALEKSELDALYKDGAEDAWDSVPEHRKDWLIARDLCDARFPEGCSILDVGCFDGRFLALMGKKYQCYGIEINSSARRRAQARGITVVGDDFSALVDRMDPVDCITAFDVIEHVRSPREFLTHCVSVLNPNGCIVVATGNRDSLAFSLMGPAFWYSTVSEHISFISPRWCKQAASALGLSVEKYVKYSHGRRDWRHYPPELLKNVLYRTMPRVFWWLRCCGLGAKDVSSHRELARQPPVWMSAKDHFITVFRKV